MSWWTDFRDSALTGAGLKTGVNAAKTVSLVSRRQYKAAVEPAVAELPQPTGNNIKNSTFTGDKYARNKWMGSAVVAVGVMLFAKLINKGGG